MKAILLSGIAGSGKSTWAKKYAEQELNTIILSTDEIRYELFRSYTPDKKDEKQVISTILARAKYYSHYGISVIIDTAIVKNKSRIKWFNRLRQYYKEVDLVFIDTPLEECLKRNQQRERHVPENIIKEMYNIREDISDEVKKLFKNVLIIKEDQNETN